MKIERLKVKNFCQHRELDWSIPNGIVAISGPNGSGKSNAIKAIYAALTGDFKRNEGVTLDNINKTCSEKDESYIELTFSNSGDVSTVTRSLRPNKRSLVINGGKTITAEKEVTSAIEGLIGVSTDILSDYIFVDQWKMFEVFTASKSERLSSLQSLYGLGKAEICYDEISKSISKINVPVYSESVEDIEKLIREKVLLLNSLTIKLAELNTLKVDDSDLAKQLAVVNKLIENNLMIDSITRSIESVEATLTTLNERSKKVFKDLDLEALSLEDLLGGYSSYEDLTVAYNVSYRLVSDWSSYEASKDNIDRIKDNIKEVELALSNLGEQPPKPENYIPLDGKEFNDYSDKVGAYEAKKNCLADLVSTNKCPVCQSTGKNLEPAIKLMEKSLEEDKSKIEKIKDDFSKSRAYEEDLRAYVPESVRLKTLLANHNSSLEREIKLSIEQPKVSKEEVQETYAKVSKLKLNYDLASKNINIINSSISYEVGRLEVFKANMANLKAENASSGLDATSEELVTLKGEMVAAIQKVAANKEEMIRTEESIRSTSETISMLESRKSKIVKGLEEAKINMSIKNHLESLREVMHKSNLPKKVAFNYLKQTVIKMNGYLEDFHAPFRVYSDDELMFWVKFDDGRDLPAARLSGGEKVVLALAFRLTVQFGVASGVNLLVLDEPTVGLDDDNIECLEMAFNRLRAMSKSSGLQVLIVSHEKAIERMCDHTISLYR